jgi:hypothetical protein
MEFDNSDLLVKSSHTYSRTKLGRPSSGADGIRDMPHAESILSCTEYGTRRRW